MWVLFLHQTLEAVVKMFVEQLNPLAAVEVLEHNLPLSPSSPSSLPPLPLITRLCRELESMAAADTIASVVKTLLRAKTTVRDWRRHLLSSHPHTLTPSLCSVSHQPTAAILQCLLSPVAKLEVSAMAAVVRLSREERVLLDKEFYTRCLVALRQWGQDPQAITDVYWALRQCDGTSAGEVEGETGPAVSGST